MISAPMHIKTAKSNIDQHSDGKQHWQALTNILRPGEKRKLRTIRIARKAFMAETKRNMTPSWLPPPSMARITSKRPPATSTVSNQFATSFGKCHPSTKIRSKSSVRKIHTKTSSNTRKAGNAAL